MYFIRMITVEYGWDDMDDDYSTLDEAIRQCDEYQKEADQDGSDTIYAICQE